MARRSTPQKKLYAREFPVKVVAIAPWNGLGPLMDQANAWVDEHLPGDHANYGSIWFFRRLDDARRFIADVPGLQLGEGTHPALLENPPT